MKAQTVIIVTLMSVVALIINSSEAFNFSELLDNEAYIMNQIDCVLDRSECDQNGLKIKNILPHLIQNDCEDCIPDVKIRYKMISKFLQNTHPREWSEIMDKYNKIDDSISTNE
ncbi:hypothetical protein PV325_003549 [Microctonus aethiopoides]|uniref:Uncharacterized protein n=1 Tax=Microctonus aethiopoides TaxID=144406 RepID=A0AA39F788_9HYME|nr:hypothetical protein PV325_003549 [Microctonus aethiopoides]KAK0164250.1 hypothetical protein PV328_002898 [Microctonus aethiopoides]